LCNIKPLSEIKFKEELNCYQMYPLKGVNPSIELSAISYELAQRAFAFPALLNFYPVEFRLANLPNGRIQQALAQ